MRGHRSVLGKDNSGFPHLCLCLSDRIFVVDFVVVIIDDDAGLRIVGSMGSTLREPKSYGLLELKMEDNACKNHQKRILSMPFFIDLLLN